MKFPKSEKIRLMVGGGWSDDAEREISKGGFSQLELHQGSYQDLNFLSKYSDKIKSLWISAECKSTSGIENLIWLEELQVSTALDKKFNFASLPKLKSVSLDGWFRWYASSLFQCNQIEFLRIEGYDLKDCREFSGLTNLRKLVLAKGRLESLDGLEKCQNISHIALSHLRSLSNISVINKLTKIKEVLLRDGIPSIVDANAIFSINELTYLDLTGLKDPINDTEWLSSFRKLENLILPIVSDVNWDMILSLPNIKKIYISTNESKPATLESVIELAEKKGLRPTYTQSFGTKKIPGYLIEF